MWGLAGSLKQKSFLYLTWVSLFRGKNIHKRPSFRITQNYKGGIIR
jgi:hypothetical protein